MVKDLKLSQKPHLIFEIVSVHWEEILFELSEINIEKMDISVSAMVILV